MSTTRTRVVTSIDEQMEYMRNPSVEIVWDRAREVLGDEYAEIWMARPHSDLGGSPRQLAESGDPGKMREVLNILARVEWGIPP